MFKARKLADASVGTDTAASVCDLLVTAKDLADASMSTGAGGSVCGVFITTTELEDGPGVVTEADGFCDVEQS